MEITNYSADEKLDVPVLNSLAPIWPFRLIIVGSGGSGKTNIALNLIYKYIPFNTLTVFARHLDNHQYKALMDQCEKTEAKRDEHFSFFSDDLNECPPVSGFNKENRNLVVFDDWAGLSAHEQMPVVEYFIRGRHQNISSMYLTQSYHRVPKTARLQASMVLLFKGLNEHDKKAVYNDLISVMTYKQFDALYREITSQPYGFLCIDLQRPELHLRSGFDKIWVDDSSILKSHVGTVPVVREAHQNPLRHVPQSDKATKKPQGK